MKKFKLALLILGISLFASCSGDTVENTAATEATKAKLVIIARDAVTNELVDGVTITLQSPKKSATTKGGIVTFKDVRIGTHNIKVEKAGYASLSVEIPIDYEQIPVNETEGENLFSANEGAFIVSLYPETATAEGYVFYTNARGVTLPAEGAKVYIDLGEEHIKRLLEAETDADGKYTFTELPAGSYVKDIRVVAPEGGLDGIVFESTNIPIIDEDGHPAPIPSGNSHIPPVTFTLNNANFVPEYKSTVAKNGNIVFTFTEDIDQSQITVGNAVGTSVRVYYGSTTHPASIKFGSNTVTISPLPEWRSYLDGNTDDNIIVRFSNLKSVTGKSYSREIEITLELKDLSKAVVSGLDIYPSTQKFDYSDYRVSLIWNAVEGADYYIVYRQNDKDSTYRKIKEVKAIKGATAYNTNNDVDDNYDDDGDYHNIGNLNGRTVSYKVVAGNKTSISPIAQATALVVKDNTAPKLTSSGISGQCAYFTEPVSKKALTVAPTLDASNINVTGGGIADYGTNVCITGTVTAGSYTISGIKDQIGNDYSGTAVTITVP